MSAEQTSSWHGLFDLAEREPGGWALVGGQMVHLWCAERGVDPYRSTPDVDAVLDVRRVPTILMKVTNALEASGFEPKGETLGGKQHRWVRGEAIIDVLIPENLGRSADNKGSGGAPGLETPGAQYALNRAEAVLVRVGDREGTVWRPSLVGACVVKSAAHSVGLDLFRARHLDDLALLASMLTRSDLQEANINKGERKYLTAAISAAERHPATDEIEGATAGLARLATL